MIISLRDAHLYGILDTGYVQEHSLESVAEALLKGGVDLLQFRAKGYDEEGVMRLLQSSASRLQDLCKEYNVPLIINDFAHVGGCHRGRCPSYRSR